MDTTPVTATVAPPAGTMDTAAAPPDQIAIRVPLKVKLSLLITARVIVGAIAMALIA